MKLNQIARVILNLRSRPSSGHALQGELMEQLKAEGYQEALRLRWIVPDIDTGGIHISSSPKVIGDIRKIVEDNEANVGDEVEIVENGRAYSAVVKSKSDDGVELDFSGEKPATVKPRYTHEELKVTKAGAPAKTSQPSVQPATSTAKGPGGPTVSAAGAPSGPGIGSK